MSLEINIRSRAQQNLRKHSHWLIREGYARMDAGSFINNKEPEITGELCREIQEYMELEDTPEWCLNYTVHDDPKVNVDGKLGDARPRIDIGIERVQKGKRPVFCFEAKRLGPNHPIGPYLGEEGLGALLSGYYPLTHDEAGMLGYYHENDADHWFNEIEKKKTNCTKYPFLDLHLDSIVDGLDTWVSKHANASIWHTLLRFW